MKLDIKKIKIPTKQIKCSVFDQTITIYPITGFGLLKIKELSQRFSKNEQDIQAQKQAVRLALKYGAKSSDQDIQWLLQNALIACMEILKEVVDFSSEYAQTIMKQNTKAKKNQKK